MQAWPRRAFTPHGSGFDPNETGSSCFDPKAKFAQGRTDQSALGLPEGRQKPNDRLCAVALQAGLRGKLSIPNRLFSRS